MGTWSCTNRLPSPTHPAYVRVRSFRAIFFIAYSLGLVAFVLSLRKKHLYRYQFERFAYCHIVLFGIVAQSSVMLYMIFEGIIWWGKYKEFARVWRNQKCIRERLIRFPASVLSPLAISSPILSGCNQRRLRVHLWLHVRKDAPDPEALAQKDG